jgi:hypothetical protein
VNGVGLVSADTNAGAYYSITPVAAAVPNHTSVTFDPTSGSTNPAGGAYGSTVTFSATLGGAVTNVGRPIVFALGGNTLTGITDASGRASVTWPLIQAPGTYQVTASYAGDPVNIGSFASRAFSLGKAATSLTLAPGPATATDSGIVATLKDDHGVAMDQRSVFFVISNTSVPANSLTRTVITKADGTASVGKFPLPPGSYTVKAYFLGTIPLLPSASSVTLTDEAYDPSSSGAAASYSAAGPAQLTIAFTAASKPYDGSTAASITGCTLIGVVGTPDVHCSTAGATAVFADASPSTFKTVTGTGFTLTGADSANYTFNSTAYTTAAISKAPQTITFAAPADRAYSPASLGVGASSTSGLTVGFSATGSCILTGPATVQMTGVGSCTITASQPGNGNYAAAADIARTFNISRAPSTVSINNIPAGAIVGGSFTPTFTGTGDGTASATSSTPSTCTVSGAGVVSYVGAGTCTLQASITQGANYLAATGASQSFPVKANQTITFGSLAQKKLGDPDFTVTATATSGLPVTLTASPSTVCTVTGSTVKLIDIGTCSITASQAGNASYNAAPSVTQAFKVIWPFTGFLQPVDNLPTWNSAKAGQAIPVKFGLGGNRGLSIFLDASYPKAVVIACPGASAPVDVIEAYATSTSGLQYDSASGTYTYVWKTAKSLVGTCYQLQLGLKDGNTVPVANFKFN